MSPDLWFKKKERKTISKVLKEALVEVKRIWRVKETDLENEEDEDDEPVKRSFKKKEEKSKRKRTKGKEIELERESDEELHENSLKASEEPNGDPGVEKGKSQMGDAPSKRRPWKELNIKEDEEAFHVGNHSNPYLSTPKDIVQLTPKEKQPPSSNKWSFFEWANPPPFLSNDWIPSIQRTTWRLKTRIFHLGKLQIVSWKELLNFLNWGSWKRI